jgi:hypothetical protein
MSYINYALGHAARQRAFGNFNIPDFPYKVPFDSMRQIAAMVPSKYERGMFYYKRNTLNPLLQKIQVCDIIWSLWGTDVQALEQEAEVQYWVNIELASLIMTYNAHSEEKIQSDMLTFYSDNPDYLPDTVPRIIVCRLSRPADFA